MALATTLVDELAEADVYLFAVPLYNFGVSQHFKTYADLVIADPRMSPDLTPVTAGKPGVLVTVQGGNYAPGTPKEGWDHATAWMRRILQDVWQIELEVVTREFTLVGVNPALDAFTEMAEERKPSPKGTPIAPDGCWQNVNPCPWAADPPAEGSVEGDGAGPGAG